MFKERVAKHKRNKDLNINHNFGIEKAATELFKKTATKIELPEGYKLSSQLDIRELESCKELEQQVGLHQRPKSQFNGNNIGTTPPALRIYAAPCSFRRKKTKTMNIQ